MGVPEENESGPRVVRKSRSGSRLQFILTRVSCILHKVRVILVYSVEHERGEGRDGKTPAGRER